MQAKLCVSENIPVIPIPGPCAFVAALSASGLDTDEFTFGELVVWFLVDVMSDSALHCGKWNRIWCLQSDFLLSMLARERRGWWFLQMRWQLKCSMYLRTSLVSFLKRLLSCLVIQGNCTSFCFCWLISGLDYSCLLIRWHYILAFWWFKDNRWSVQCSLKFIDDFTL